ncbi:hypothetical protein [Sphingobium sp. KCTC 72723]|uniref:hypothetical protein n=1 Tax=Sphingobium sp. KCTC 72723 TaxID=2733867 RepID=UPI00165D5461|nr:hypothetical protein [Sphingobium sp. KCTC 72723]
MMATALLLQAAVPVAAPAPPLSAKQLTMPIVEATCKIADPDGRAHDLRIRQTGGRGYDVPRNGSTHRARTDVKHTILRDTAGVFDGFEFQIGPRETWPGDVKAFKRPGQTVQMQTFGTGRDDKYAILLRRKWSNPDVDLLGFCDVKKTPQTPLDAAETEEATRQ